MHTEVRAIIKKEKEKEKKSHLLFPLLSPVSLCVGQSETHSAGGLRKHEDGGRLHSKARASGLRFTHNERVGRRGGGGAEERRGKVTGRHAGAGEGEGGGRAGGGRKERRREKEKG